MDWTEKHELCLACETVHRAQVWQQFADTLCSYDTATFTVSKRSEEEGNEAKRKTEQDKSKTQEIRKTAMENLGETKKRKLVNGEQDDATSLPLI